MLHELLLDWCYPQSLAYVIVPNPIKREKPDSYKNIKHGICIIAPGMSKAVHSSKPEKVISGHLEMPNTSFCFPSA
jgi:hypothetical protein